MNTVNIIILAAGHGTRMQHELPKPLVPLQGKPMIQYLLESIADSGVCSDPIIVVNPRTQELFEEKIGNYRYALQEEQLGTGHAAFAARSLLEGSDNPILVLYGDMPFVSKETIMRIAETAHSTQAKLTMATTIVPDFDEWRSGFYGFSRIIRDDAGNVLRTVEKKDATEEELSIKEVNPAYLCFDPKWLWSHKDALTNNNTQKEYYLTDLIKISVQEGHTIATVVVDPKDAIGINTKEHLAVAETIVTKRS